MWLPGAELHVAHRAHEARGELPDRDAEDHAGGHPQAQVALEDVHASGLSHAALLSYGRARASTAGGRLMPSRFRSRSTRHSSSTLTRRSSRSRRASASTCGSRAMTARPARGEPRQLVVVEPVEHPAAVLALAHQARPLEVGEMRGDGGGGEVEHGRHLAHAQLAAAQHGQDAQADRVGQGLQDVDGRGASRHFVTTRNVVAFAAGVNGSDDPGAAPGESDARRGQEARPRSCAPATPAARRWPRAGSTTCSAASGRRARREPRRPRACTRSRSAPWPRPGSTSRAGRPSTSSPYLDQPWDLVVTVCDSAQETCPASRARSRSSTSRSSTRRAEGTDDEKMAVFRRVRDEIRDRLVPEVRARG